ncbi:unnamed protein product, partial [Meganyctiphanes norvegica]
MCCVMFMGFIGFSLVICSIFMLAFPQQWDKEFWNHFDRDYSPIVIPMLSLGSIGALLAIISCCLCIIAKINRDKQRSQEATAPYSEPFTEAENSPEHVYSGQIQPAVWQPALSA